MNELLHVIRLVIDTLILPVGSDPSLGWTPKMVHRVEFGGLLGQIEPVDAKACRQAFCSLGKVATGLIEDQAEPAAVVAQMQQTQKSLELLLAHGSALHQHPVSGFRIDRAKEHSARVGPGDSHLWLRSTPGPLGPQGWEQPQDRLLLKEHNCMRIESLYTANQRPFFCGRCGSAGWYT